MSIVHPHARLDAQDAAGLIEWSANGRPSLIRPPESSLGAKINNIWYDIPRAPSNERTGYPTQKPLALYERIILASSDPGDLVLDPFCSCATTPIAAERLGRQWVGMDIWDRAHEQVIERMQANRQLLADPDSQVFYSTSPPH